MSTKLTFPEPPEQPEPAPVEPEQPTAAPEPEPEPEPEPAPEPAAPKWPQAAEPPRSQRKQWLSVTVALLVLLGMAAVVPFTPVMPARSVAVEGNRILPTDRVRELTGIAPDTPMGRVNVHRAAEGVAADPWVKTVTVSRDWPDTIQVAMEEHVAVAFIAQQDGTHLIDQEGKDFLTAEPPADAIELVNAPVDDEVQMADVVDIAASISERARGQIASIEAGPYNNVLRTVDGRTVYWGKSEDNANKAIALEAVLQMEGTEFNITNPQLVTSK